MSIVQGLTEFLPVSSQAHLILLAQLTAWQDHGQVLEVAAHGGSLLAIVLYFYKEVLSMLRGVGHSMVARRSEDSELLWKVVLASIPVMAVGLAVKLGGWAETLRTTQVIAIATIFFGLMLLVADRRPTNRTIKQLGLGGAFAVGVFQCFALIPGASRSGVAMTMGRFLGLSAGEAARFSMLLSMPAILGAVTLTVADQPDILLSPNLITIAALSFVASLAAVTLMLKWLERAGFGVFVCYRLILGAVLLTATG